jgi:hypothetical protein
MADSGNDRFKHKIVVGLLATERYKSNLFGYNK